MVPGASKWVPQTSQNLSQSSPDAPPGSPDAPFRAQRAPGRVRERSKRRQDLPSGRSGELPGLQKTYDFHMENLQFPLERSTRAPPAQDSADGAAGGPVRLHPSHQPPPPALALAHPSAWISPSS